MTEVCRQEALRRMNPLTFAKLSQANAARVGQFKNRLGVLAHTKADGSDWTIAEWTNAMAGECGEACNFSKKIRRGDFDHDPALGNRMLAKELADTIIYADLAAQRQGINLGEAVRDKFNEKSEEISCDVKL